MKSLFEKLNLGNEMVIVGGIVSVFILSAVDALKSYGVVITPEAQQFLDYAGYVLVAIVMLFVRSNVFSKGTVKRLLGKNERDNN